MNAAVTLIASDTSPECSNLASDLAVAALRGELRGLMCVYTLTNGEYVIGLAGNVNHDPALALGYASILEHAIAHRACSSSPDCPLAR